MGALLESGIVGNIGLKHLRVIKEDTIKKWDDLGFLEGLNGHQRDNIAQLYENQASFLINEAAVSDASGSFETVVFPIIRRVFSKLLANDLVSVQAMNLPIGKLFYFIPKIQERNNGAHYAPYGMPGNADAATAGYNTNTKNLYDRFYEASDANDQGLFDYSKGAYTGLTATVAGMYTFSNGVATSAATISGVTTVSSVIIKVSGFTSGGAGKLIGANGNEMDTEEFLASLNVASNKLSGHTTSTYTALPFNVVTNKYGKGIVEYGSKASSGAYGTSSQYYNVCDAEGFIYLQVDLQAYGATGYTNYAVISGATLASSDFTVTYRQYGSLEFEDEIGEVSFDLESVTVSVTERKLRASWSPELAQDVSAFHNIDAEAELTALLSEQIAAEIDREILRDLRKGAAWTTKWDYNEWKYGNNGSSYAGYTQKDWNQTLITKINQISAQIHKTTLRGGANWIVVSSEVSAVFDDLEYFHVSNADPEQDSYNMGIEKIGTLAGRYQVFRDPYFPAGKILIGHKGKSLLDAGYVYAPYVPLQLTPTMFNPFNMTPIKGIMSRYAKKLVNNRYYGLINVNGLASFSLDTLR
jgi:hypothetical protein